jgi:leader peptidase (prepilin peptidase)/N-methyltransferase
MQSLLHLLNLPAEAATAVCWSTAVWFFGIGTAIGSFLNVVVYRLPRGMSLLWPGSRCPGCKTPIRAYDNVPILSWLMLRGRCRKCGASISIRYPLVELTTGVLFLAIVLVGPLADRMSWLAYGGAVVAACAALVASLVLWDRRMG